jgi:dTDP-4-amino-4,6-dideoxygalactose transaminase
MEPFIIPRDPQLGLRFLTARARRTAPAGPGTRHRLFWARNGIFHALRAFQVPAGARVLVPAYLCASAVEPILAYGAAVEFYAIRPDLRVDLDDLAARIGHDTKAVLAVHYFGFPQPMTDLRQLCDARGLWLLEDCAHVLTGEIDGRPLGTVGDASVFSLRKFLPLYDGAELRVNFDRPGFRIAWCRTTPLFALKVAKNLVEMTSGPLGRALRGRLSVGAWRDRLCSGGPTGDAHVLAMDTNSTSFDPAMVDMPMSAMCCFIADHSDVPAIVAQRRRNYHRLQRGLATTGAVAFALGELPTAVCPWILPVFFPGIEQAHLRLRARGIPAVTWGGVRPLGVSAAEFPAADFLYDRLVFLPIHQGLDDHGVDLMIETVRSVCREAATSAPSSRSVGAP